MEVKPGFINLKIQSIAPGLFRKLTVRMKEIPGVKQLETIQMLPSESSRNSPSSSCFLERKILFGNLGKEYEALPKMFAVGKRAVKCPGDPSTSKPHSIDGQLHSCLLR